MVELIHTESSSSWIASGTDIVTLQMTTHLLLSTIAHLTTLQPYLDGLQLIFSNRYNLKSFLGMCIGQTTAEIMTTTPVTYVMTLAHMICAPKEPQSDCDLILVSIHQTLNPPSLSPFHTHNLSIPFTYTHTHTHPHTHTRTSTTNMHTHIHTHTYTALLATPAFLTIHTHAHTHTHNHVTPPSQYYTFIRSHFVLNLKYLCFLHIIHYYSFYHH